MSLAETAVLAVELKLGTSGSFAGATSQIKGVEAAAAAATGRGMGALQSGFGKASTAAGKFGGALGHAKGALGELLTGPLGVLGLAGGVGGLGIAFEHVITHTNDFAFSVEKLGALTGETADKTSTLLAVFEKYNISAERTGQIVGFAEKTLGNLAAKSGALATIQKEYGLSLVDSQGKVVDFSTELSRVADLYAKSTDKAGVAALAAKLFGRGYADLVPILARGSAGIDEASAAASKFGLVINQSQATDLKAYRDSLRELGDATGGLELQLGLALIPAIKHVAEAITTYLANGGREQVVGFFKSAIKAAEDLAGFLTGTVVPAFQFVGGAAKSAWDAIPPEIRDLLIKGFVANKAIKFVFGVDIAGGVADVIKKAFAGAVTQSLVATGIGKAFVQPVFVTNPGFGGPGGAAGAAEGALAGAAEGGVGLAAGIAGALAIPLAIVVANTIKTVAGVTDAQQQYQQTHGQFGPRSYSNVPIGPMQGPPVPAGMVIQYAGDTRSETNAITRAVAAAAGATGQKLQDIKDAAQGSARSVAHVLDALHRDFRTDLHSLITATKANDIAKAAKRVAAEINKGVGNADTTKAVLADLKRQLSNTHDPKLQAVLRDAIGKVQAKIPGREYVQQQIAKANALLNDGKVTRADLKTIAGIERALKDHGLPSAAAAIQKKVDEARRAQVAASHATTAAVHADTQAIKDKDLSVSVFTSVSVRDNQNAIIRYSRYGVGPGRS